MNALTPLAVANADLLREIRSGMSATKAALAIACNRDKSNLGKTLQAMEAAGLTTPAPGATMPALTEAGVAALAAIERAEGPAMADAGDRDANAVRLTHAQIVADPANPRRHFDDGALQDLAAAIFEHGLMQPLVVRSQPDADGRHVLVAGERRHRAIGRLIAAGRWSAAEPIPCRLHAEADAARLAIAALVENLQRVDLTPLEEAEAFQALMTADPEAWPTAAIAQVAGKSQRFVQLRLQLLDQPEAVLDALAKGEIGADAARRLARLPEADKAELAAGEITVAEALERTETAPPELVATAATGPDILDPQLELILVEVQHACATRPKESPLGPAGVADRAPDLKVSPAEAELAAGGFLRYEYDAVVMLKPAQAYLNRLIFSLSEPQKRLRKAREDAGLDAETIARLESEELYATAWLNERYPPKKLSAAEALVLLELADACKDESRSFYYAGTKIQPEPADPAIAALEARNLVRGPVVKEGFSCLSGTWDSEKALARRHPGWEKKPTRAKILAGLRTEVLGAAAADAIAKGAYATAWLNGPFEQNPEDKAAAERQAAEETAREERAEQQRAAERAVAERRLQLVDDLERDLPTLAPDAVAGRFAEVLEGLNGPAPWTKATGYWSIATAANGSTVDGNSDMAKRVVMLAVNFLAGVDLAALAAAGPAKPDRVQFERWIAVRLQEIEPDLDDVGAGRLASRALEEWLTADGTAFGADEYTWAQADAEAFADGYAWELNLVDLAADLAREAEPTPLEAAIAETELAEANT